MKMKKISALVAAAVSLGLAGQAQAANDRYIIQVDNKGKGIVKALAKQMGGRIELDSLGFIAATFEGMSLEQVKGVMNNPHVKLIEEDLIRKPMALYNDGAGDPMTSQVVPYAVKQSQADQVVFDPNAGMKVCVIDSGLDMSNPDFNWAGITGDNDSGTGNWYEHGGPHGTHVAGTIGAADNNIGVIGMAPGVDMHIIKVFNEAGWGYSSDLAHAANLCGAAGANIINMSLGGGGSNSTESNAFQSFTDNGGLVLAAAGNDGNNVRSYPAGYSSVMMVGANDGDNNIADFSQFPSCTVTTGRGKNATTTTDETVCVEVTAGGVDTLSTYPAGMATSASMSADGVGYASSSMENAGYANGATYFMGTAQATDTGANGKICMIDRGVISFHDKVANCEASGGIGAVIINNEPGMLYGTLGDSASNTTSIPAVGAAQEDRSALLAASTATVNIGSSDYGLMSGTSMATPAVAGVAALVWSNHPTCTGTEIRNALKATAEDQGTAGPDVYFGYGIVKAKAASDYLALNGCTGGTGGGGSEPPATEMDASGTRSKGGSQLNISWSGFTSSNVDIRITYSGGVALEDTTANDGSASYSGASKSTTYTVEVCQAGSTTACAPSFTL